MRGTTGQAVVAGLAGLAAAGVLAVSWPSSAQTEDRLRDRVRQEQAAYLSTLKDLVSIESGSRDAEGLDRAAAFIAGRLRALGGEVEVVPPPADMARLEDTPPQPGKAVVARFRGTGTGRVLLLSHMDTVYERGLAAKQPFRVEGDRAYGLGIADDKSGVALALHAVALLQALGHREYGVLTVLVNADEEISSIHSRPVIYEQARLCRDDLAAAGRVTTLVFETTDDAELRVDVELAPAEK